MSSELASRKREQFLSEFSQSSRPQPDQIQAQLERILKSDVFIRSARMKRLLEFLVQTTLNNPEYPLKESVIGRAVFDRPTDYDPKADPIVRVEMRRVRGKLSEYYLSEGLGDPVLVWLEKGSYIPVLAARTLPTPLLPKSVEKAELLPLAPAFSAGFARPPNANTKFVAGRRLRVTAALALTILVGAAVCWPLLHRSPNLTRSRPPIPLTGNAGLELSPAFSPDGKLVAYSWDGNRRNLDIYTTRIGAGIPHRLTDNAAHELHPAWSPDGKRIAFLRVSPEESQIVVIPGLGGIETVIATNTPPLVPWHADQPEQSATSGPVWSPDGLYLVVSGCLPKFASCGLIKTYLDGRQKLLTASPKGARDRDPAISASNRAVAFVRTWGLNSTDIFVMPLQGGIPVRLTFDNRDIKGLAWLDKQHLVYSSNRDGAYRLWQVALSGGPIRLIPVSAGRSQFPTVSADGHWLAFVESADDASIWRASLVPNNTAQAEPFLSSNGSDDSPAFAPTGRRLVFVSTRTGTAQLWVSGSDGSDVRQLVDFPGSAVGTPRWSPDNQRIVFDASLNGQSGIWLIDSDGSNLHRLNDGRWPDYMPSWSHDGRWVYYVSLRNGRDQLWKQRPDNGEMTQITSDAFFDAVEYLDLGLIYAERENGGIWQIPLKGGQPVPVPELAGVQPTRYWTLAGDKLYFLRQESAPRDLEELDLKTRRIHKLTNIPGQLLASTPGLAVDPASQSLLFVQQSQHRTGIVLQER